MGVFRKIFRKIKKLADDVGKLLRGYDDIVKEQTAEKLISLADYQPELLEALNIALMEFIVERFQYLSTAISLSKDWIEKKKQRWPTPVKRSHGYYGPTLPAKPANARRFGQATGYLLDQVLLFALSHNVDHPGFSELLTVTADSKYTFEYEIVPDHFFFIRAFGHSYPEYLDARVQREKGFGLIQMRPPEQVKFFEAVKKAFRRLTGVAGALDKQIEAGLIRGGIR